jgi:hypothetical protein
MLDSSKYELNVNSKNENIYKRDRRFRPILSLLRSLLSEKNQKKREKHYFHHPLSLVGLMTYPTLDFWFMGELACSSTLALASLECITGTRSGRAVVICGDITRLVCKTTSSSTITFTRLECITHTFALTTSMRELTRTTAAALATLEGVARFVGSESKH